MIIDCISDMHGEFPKLLGGDILLIAGDITSSDRDSQWWNFFTWLGNQDYRHKIFIAGNHDGHMVKHGSGPWINTLKDAWPPVKQSWHYLCDCSIEIEGLKIYGMPWTPEFFNWHFMKKRGAEMREVVKKIPLDTDILITHGPAFGMLDRCVLSSKGDENRYAGCHDLADHLLEMKNLKLHVFGHIHEDHGWCYRATEVIDDKEVYYGHLSVNACIMDGDYDPVYKPTRVIYEDGKMKIPSDEENPYTGGKTGIPGGGK